MNDKRDQLYDNLINSGRVSEDEIGNREQFKAAISDEATSRQFYNNIINSGVLTADDIGSEDDFYNSISSDFSTPAKQTYQPSAEDMKGFMGTISRAGNVASGSIQNYDRRTQNLQKRQGLNVPQRVNIGESNNLVQGNQKINPETGQLENTYITSSGNEYDNKVLADMEQRQQDQLDRDRRYAESLPGQLEQAYAERDRLNEELGKIQGQWVDQDGRVHYGNRGNDETVAALEAALRQNQQRITSLEAERDDDGGTQFWRGFIDAAKNPSVQSFGLTDFNDMLQLMRIKNKMDSAIEAGEQPQLTDAEQSLMQSSFLNNYAQSQYGENRGLMYRAGGISMQALPFVAEFMATGGFGALTEKGAELGTRAAEKLALQGLSKTLMKNLGVVAGDVAAGWAMANTTGLFRTTGDIMQRNIGGVTMNPEGKYDFGEYDEEGNFKRGGKSLGQSIYEAEVANTLEYYTEKLGEHLQIGKWLAKGAEKMGLSKLSKVVNYLSGNKWLERGGIQDYPSEVVEEEANLLLNAMLVGDNTFSNPDDPKSVINPKTQSDIWGGMLFSIGLMQAPRLAQTGYSALGYYKYKKATDASDANASAVFGADNWQMIKEQIDNCSNEDLSELLSTVVNGDMSDEQKQATMNYAGNLIKMRGYNMGMMAGAKDLEESMSEHGVSAQAINQSYIQGHETQEPDLMKQYNDEALEAGSNLQEYGFEFWKMVSQSETPVETLDYLMQNRDIFTDEQIAAAADYYQKISRVNGAMDGALDRVDLEVERANAEVRSNTHQQTGNIITAQVGDDACYVVGGDVFTDPITGAISVLGTGGAVVVKNAFTGEISVKSPQELTITSTTLAEDMIRYNEEVLRQQLIQQADDDMTFGSPANEVYQLEDTVALNDGNGNIIEGQIGMMPNSVDGVYVVYTPDNKALQFTADQLNRMIVAHNGQEVQRANTGAPSDNQQVTDGTQPIIQPSGNEIGLNQVNNSQENNQKPFDNGQSAENISNQPQPVQSGETTGGEASAENGTGANEPPVSALSRIPVLTDDKGQPVLKKGRPQYQWHKASTEDAAAALIETTGGDMVMARDTASDLVKNAQSGLEKIRKQKPKGEDPIEIAESRMEIKRQEQEQQAIIKQWQDVNQAIQKQMRDEAAARQAEIEAAKSEEQRQREAEEAEERKKRQDETDRQRIREAIERDHEKRNKVYDPLSDARKDMADDPDATAILQDAEPRSLEEWVSSLILPHSMLWQDASESETGLQSELGLKRNDMQRMMSLLGTKESGAKPFNQVVLDIHEGLPEAMKEQYTDQDVRNTLLNLFNEGSSTRMMHLTEENRIAEAREAYQENLRRAAEYEMEQWAEAYHLTPEERETFEDYMSQAPSEPEQEIINNIIADESYRISTEEDQQSDSRADVSGSQRGESQVQQTAQATGNGNNEAEINEGTEDTTGKSPASDDTLSGEGSVIPTPEVDIPRYNTIRQNLVDAYAAVINKGGRDPKTLQAVRKAANEIRKYVDEGLDDYNNYEDGIEDYEGNDPEKLADQYITRVYHDRYLDDDADKLYILHGLKPEMRQDNTFVKYNGKKFEANENGICINPNVIRNRGNRNIGYDISTALSDKGWVGSYSADGPTWGGGSGVSAGWYDNYFETEEECQAYHAQHALDYIKQHKDPKMKKYEVALQAIIDKNGKKPTPIKQSEQLKPTDLRDAVRVESSEIGVAEANAKARQASGNVYNQFRGKLRDAVNFLIKKKEGRAKAVLHREGFGDIDIIWGNTKNGLNHIIRKHIIRLDDFDSIDEMVKIIQDVIENGTYRPHGEDVRFEKDGYRVVVAKDEDGNFVLTAYDITRKQEEKKRSEEDATHLDQSIFAEDGTLVPQTQLSSDGKVTNNPANLQEKTEESLQKPQNSFKRPGTNTPEGEILVKGGTNLYTKDGNVINVIGSNIDKALGERRYTCALYENEQKAKEDSPITKFLIYQQDMRKQLASGEYSKAKPVVKAEQPKKNEPKRLVSDEKMEELRKQLRNKLNNLNAGIDPEMMLLGAMYAVGNIERGVTKFADYAKKMVTDLGDKIRPYLKSFYNAVRDMPEAQEYVSQMDDYATVSSFDVYNFDKQQDPDTFTKAEQVVTEKRINSKASKIKQMDLFAGDLFGSQEKPKAEQTIKGSQKKRKPQLPDFDSLATGKRFVTPDGTIEIARVDYDTLQVWDIDADGNRSRKTRTVDTVDIADGLKSGTITEVGSSTSNSEPRLRPATEADLDSSDAKWYHNGKPVYIMLLTRRGEQVSATQFSKPTVESVMLTNGKSVKLEDLMVEDTSAIGATSTPAQVAAEENKVDTNPSKAQKEAGNYQKGHIKVDGYDITIENPKGSIRRGTDASGKPWETEMHNTYGYIRGTEGVDGDHIDVFLSDNPTNGSVYVVDQINPETGEFDEHKVMYGFGSEEEAREAYLANYSKGWKGLGNITEVSREDFKKWIESSHRKTKPFAEYKSVKKEPAKPNLDKNDYRTYMTPEAQEYFANDPRFAKFPHRELAFVTAAVWDGVVIPVEELAKIPSIVEAEQRVKAKEQLKPFTLTKEQIEQNAQHLLDAEHGSAVYENGKMHKINGQDDFTGAVKQERKAFVIIGRPAGGKSSVFANPLSNQYGARIIDSDVVKEWFDEFDDGYGAGYVQEMSSAVAERALDIAAQNGENIILPRIGGSSVIRVSTALRLLGYDVQLYYNDVVPDTSYMRSTSRFAMTGRYLSLDYLTSIKDKPSKNFSNFAKETIGGYLDECTEKQIQQLRGRLESLAGGQRSDLWRALSWPVDEAGRRDSNGTVQGNVGERGSDGTSAHLDLNAPIYSYSEWKSNDVAFGEKPKEIWNSESGKPMPGKKEGKNNETEQKVSGKPESTGEGTEQASGSARRTGAEPGTESDRTQRTGSGSSVETQQSAVSKQAPKHNNRRNNVGERGQDYAPTSPKARFNANVEAIKLMRLLNDEGIEAPTKDQMEVLRKYSGWGGMGTYFNDESSAENKQLRDILTDEEYNDAVMSINSAYYTPAIVIDSLWDIAKAMGFKGGNILEGSAGIGNIIGQMPKDISSRSDIEAVEIDSISGNILKLLYPDAKVHIQGFQDTMIPNGTVDLAVTNVPFVTGLHVIDKVDKDLSRKFTNIHDFCIAKNIRKLREGGIGLFITSAGTMDKSTKLREWITDEGQADVVGAFRLNNTTFGGTNVTSDIIVVRKRTKGQKSPVAIDVAKASPLRVGTWTDKYGEDHQVSMVVNDYFRDHPEMMAGEMAFGYEKGDTFRPGSYGLYPKEVINQEKMLADFAKDMSKAKEVAAPKQQTEEVQNQLTAEKEGRMLVDKNGRLCVSERGIAVPLGLNDQKVKGYTKAECFADYQTVQKAVDDVLQQQLNDPDDAALKPKLNALNKAYDKFTKRYGTLHKNTAISFLRNDIDFPSFQALENYSETKDMKGKVTVKTAKTPLFSQRVLGFKTEPKPKTIKDAVISSIFRTNNIDLGWISDKLGKSEDDVRNEILSDRLAFEDPSTGNLEIRYKYLSGNVREKLSIAENYNTDGKYSANVEELRKAVPMDIPSHLIDFSLGSSWIPVELYKDYLKETLDLDNVKLSHVEGTWVLDEGYNYRNEKNRSAGVYSEKFRETIYGHQLVAAALNNRPVKVSKQVSEGYGSNKTTKTVVDQAATQACAVRVDEIKDEFKQWAKKRMQDDPDLAHRIEKIYNDKFNALVPMQIDEEFLPERFEGANMNISLYDHQKRGVMRGLTSPTMLAHEVGTGKSFTLISTAMEMRRLGTAKKPMIVVQNATVAQMTSDAKLLYPNAKVLSLSEKDRSAEGRRAFYAKIKYNDWDLIIIPQSTFERIPDSPERELQFIQEKIDEKKHVIEAAEAAGMDSREIQRLKKELEKIEQEYGDTYLDNDSANTPKKKKKDAKREAASLDKAETKAKEMLDRAVDDVQFFDDLGVDALLVDEAHEYKHLGFQTSIGRGIKGIDPSYSKKCAGLYNKTRSVFEKAGWKNVVFATGTPISNTAAEIWTFMKYLMPADVMKQNDIYYFDDFVHNFGNISQMLEFATSGKFKENTRFAAYVNKPELIRIWSQVADTVLTKEVGEVKSKVPEKEGGKDQDVFLPQSPSLISIMAAVRAELERFENMDGKQKKENSHIPLTMYGIAKRAAIDPRLVNPDAPDEPLSKTNAAVKEIVKDLNETKSYKGTVAVFCDNQNRKGDDGSIEFNIYDDMREKLIAQGVPANQIAIIRSGMSIVAKQKVFDAVNSGAIRVVLGSTQTLGTGVNMQERLHLLIHMDAPDRPMDYTQRNGRIERQGNLHKVWGKPIRIIRFGVEDSLDVTAYQRLKTKSGFIDSIMDGKAALVNNQVDRTVEEEEEGLFDNPVAVLSGSQYALKKNQAERELRKYQGKKAQWEADQVYITNSLRYNKTLISSTEENIKEEEKRLENIKKLFPDGKVKTITVEGVQIDMTKDDGAKKLGEAIKEKINDPVNATVKKLRENQIYDDESEQYTIELDGHPVNFTVSIYRTSEWDGGKMKTVIHKGTQYSSPDLQSDSMMSARSVRDYLDEITEQVVTGIDYQDRIDAYKAKIERVNSENEQMRQREGQPFQFDKELENARKNVEEYTELMKQEMQEKEAKYAQQQKEVEDNGNTFNLAKAEESSEEDELYRADEDEEPTFFSNAMMAVEGIRQEKATPEQWLSMITKAGGLKAAEDKWLGLSEWLENSNKRTLTKDEILDYIMGNQIDVEEIHYSDRGGEIFEKIEKTYPGFEKAYSVEADDFDGTPSYSIRDLNAAVDLYNNHHPENYRIDVDDEGNITDDQYDDLINYAAELFELGSKSAEVRGIDPTRLNYTTNGLDNKREIALVVPSIDPYRQDDTIHFGDAGEGRAVAWVRFGDTTDADGNKVLVIDEIQSKRHQDGRSKGYLDAVEESRLKDNYLQAVGAAMAYRKSLHEKYPEMGDIAKLKNFGTPEEYTKEMNLTHQSIAAERALVAYRDKHGVPDAPFDKNWHELAMKRMLRYAAENGYDFVAWTTGIQQIKRYSIGKIVSSIDVSRWGEDVNGYNIDSDNAENERGVYLNITNRENIALEVNRDGIVTYDGGEGFKGRNISEVVGKDLAVKILGTKGEGKINLGDLRIGGEGMKGFYDEILPRFMNKYGKKWGVQVNDIELPQLEPEARRMHSVEVTPAMRQSVLMGQPMFREIESFKNGESFPIRKTTNYSSYNVLGTRNSYSVDLLPDEYATQQSLLNAVRNFYPEYFVTLENDSITMQTWESVMTDALNLNRQRKAKGTEAYVERKTRNAINAVSQLADMMHLNVEVLTTTDGLTGKKARSKGFFNPKTGKITIVLPNHSTQSDVINTLLHEGVAHFGLRNMFGEYFDTFLDNVYNNAEAQIKSRIDAAAKRNGWSSHVETEEYLARLAERTDFKNALNSGWWKKIKDFFVRMLAEAGLRLDAALSDNDLRYILWRSYDNLLHPDSRRTIFDKAREVDMMNRLKVGSYKERVPVRTSAEENPQVAEPEVDEVSQIISEAQANGTYLKAPNGKPTNLSEEQWAQVRTKAFKNWFGDWEHDPENASKVVDENGEPKVMYHGTNLTKNNNGDPFYVFYPESHFGTKGQSEDVLKNTGVDQSTKTYEVFLNIRKPDRNQDVPKKYYGKAEHKEWWDSLSDYAKKNGFDGIVYQNRWEDQEHPADSWIAFSPNQIKSATDNNGEYSPENDDIRYSMRTKEPPKKTGIGYKVFVLKNGQLYPPMVANPNGEGTPIGVWLDADAAPVAGTSKTGRPQVKAGGKGTQGGSGQLAYRPGWHLGEIPYALQFNRKDENGERTLFPNNFVWAEVEYADDVDYNDEARKEGTNASGKYQHSLAGLKHVPTDGSYKYRTNPDPRTDPWIITGAMRVNKILSREEVDELVRKAGREPQPIQDGDVLTQESIDALNAEIKAMKEAEDMGLLYRSDDDWGDESVDSFEENYDIARNIYEKATASDALKFQESWQDKMASLKVLQNAIEKETGKKATGAEDAYLYENRMHGKAKNQSEKYDRRFYQPLLKAADKMMKAKGWTEIRKLTDYMVAKHGLERNIFYAFKAAVTGMVRDNINKEQRKLSKRYERGEIDALTYKKEQKELEERLDKDVAAKLMEVHNDPEHIRMKEDYELGLITYADYITNEENLRRSYAPDFDDHYKDYSGLTELTGDENDYMTKALAMVDDAERDAHEEVTDLWKAVNAATKETLRFAYESGTMSRNTYNNVRAMFEYYIPLRGWEENNADDFYDYVSERNVFSTAIKKAYGRKSLAENPIAYIGNMAVSTLLAGHRNQLKQHFLNYVMNNPTSLVSVSEKWWENKGTETSPYWVEVAPEIPADATADQIADIVEAFNEEMKQKAAEGKATTTRGSLQIAYHATGAEKNEHMVEVQRAGKTYQLYINGNPKAAQALNGINEKAVSRISQTDFGKLIESINRSMAAFFTSKNPAFVLSNLSRDLTMAGASVAIKEDAAYNAQFIKNVVKVLRPRTGRGGKFGFARMIAGPKATGFTGMIPSLMRKYFDGDLDLTNETERLFGEFMDEGAETGFVNMLSVDSFKDKMQKEIARMQGTTLNIAKAKQGTKETPVGKGLRMMGDIFEFYNRCAEDATRFIVFMTSRQMGKSLEDSIADAKDVTLNFNRKGTGSKWNAVIRDLFIFVNPAIQALSNMFKMAYKHPLKFTAVTAAFFAGGALMPIVNQWLLNMFGDDDDKEAYWNLPPWVRKNNLVMWVPGTKNFITIPLAQEFRVFYGLGEMASSLIYDHPVHQWPMEILSSFMDLIPINPTGNGGNLAVDLTPTTLQPLMQLHDNVDFTGKPIWKENQGNKYAPMYKKAYISTPEWMVKLSEAVNDFTGGNEGKKGWIEENMYGGDYINNPAVWNHILQGYFGGMYNTIAKTFDVGVTAANGEMPKVYQTPVLNRFLNRPVERDNAGVLGEEYYKLTEERDRLKYELRTWQKKAADGEEGAQDHVDEILSSDDYQRIMVIDHYDKIMKDLKAGEKAATNDIDKDAIKESITLYKAEMMEELAAIDGGEDPIEAAKKKFDEATTLAEKNRLRMRIEKLTQRNGEDQKKRGGEVEKALSYIEDDDRESRKVNDRYLELATANMIADDARIRAAKQRIKQYTDEFNRLLTSGAGDKAADYRRKHQKWFKADEIIKSQSRTMNANKKLLGKGHDEAIMKLIDASRNRMLNVIEGLE